MTRRRVVAFVTTVGVALSVSGLAARRRSVRLGRRVRWSPPAAAQAAGPLTARVLGTGSPVVLLHGLTASGRYWGAAFDELAADHRLIVPDLLGFGASPRPDGLYGPEEHAAAVCACLDALQVHEPTVFVAHSAAAAVAMWIGKSRAGRVRALICVSPPFYPDRAAAVRHLSGLGFMARLFANDGRLAELACTWMCRHRELAARLAVLARPDLPAEIATDSVQHSWASYSRSLRRLVLDADTARWLAQVDAPVVIVAGDADPVCDQRWLRELASRGPATRFCAWPGHHHLPLLRPIELVELIREYARRP